MQLFKEEHWKIKEPRAHFNYTSEINQTIRKKRISKEKIKIKEFFQPQVFLAYMFYLHLQGEDQLLSLKHGT